MGNRTFVIGDIHGAHIALVQCLTRCGFDQITDTLITLGDVCDGWPYVYECVETLLAIDSINLVGNHDAWLHQWLKTGIQPDCWDQGGKGTAQSYLRNAGKDPEEFVEDYGYTESGRVKRIFTFNLAYADIPPAHIKFFNNQHLYYRDDKNRLFVHGGFDKSLTLKENQRERPSSFYWNRKLWLNALASVHQNQTLAFKEEFSQIFIGHTSTTNWTTKEIKTDAGIILPKGEKLTEPMFADILINLDTGAGSDGKLTIMDVDTLEFWQSDPVSEIYGEYKPRE